VIAIEATAADVLVAVLWLLVVVVVLWRWPALVVGVGAALVLWTVEPWMAWAVLWAVLVAAGVWRRSDRGRVVWPLMGRLVGTGWYGAVVAGAVSVVGPGSVGAGGRVVLVLLGVGALARLAGNRHRSASAAPAAPGVDVARRVTAPVDRSAHVVVQGPCPDCGGRLVATLPVGVGVGRRDVGGAVAWATCGGCGARRVAVVDPEGPGAGLVWLALPDAAVHDGGGPL
jgi:hypothetical protein